MRRMLVLVSLVTLAAGATAFGHHSYGATYDVNREITLEGKLVQFSYRNPHSYVTIQAPDDKGVQQRWSVEWSGTTQLSNKGITQQTLKVGDQVRVVGRPSRVRNEYRALMVSLLRPADGFTWGTRAGEKVD
jgi:hypothetical protein